MLDLVVSPKDFQLHSKFREKSLEHFEQGCDIM